MAPVSGGRAGVSFHEACRELKKVLQGPARREIVSEALAENELEGGLARLRVALRTDTFSTSQGTVSLAEEVREMDRRTREESFQVLRDWDGPAERFRRERVPVDMLDYAARIHREPSPEVAEQLPEPKELLGVLLDYYFFYLLALFVMRGWDEGDPNRNLDRIQELLDLLQGEDGSGHQFVETAESVLWIAISNYHPDDHAYDRILDKVRTLDEEHRFRFAWVGAPILGTHLRWGFEAYYRRDLELLRRDNFADYPWLLFSVTTLMERYHRRVEEGASPEELQSIALAILNGLTADAPALTTEIPSALADYAQEHARFRALFQEHREELVEAFRRYRPSEERYSPIAFHFNFPHNAVKAAVAMRVVGHGAPNLPLEAVFRVPAGNLATSEESAAQGVQGVQGDPEALARAFMAHSQANPEQIGSRRVMIMAYNPRTGLRSFRAALWADPTLAEVEEAEEDGARLEASPFQRGQRSVEEG